jgi:hypothetical protein
MPESPKPKEQVIITHQAVVISLTEAHKQQMQRCIERSGEVKFTFKEISITRLPTILDNGVAVD